jgi:thiaminase
MEPSARQTSAAELLADTRSRLADVEQTIRSHRFLEALAQRRVPEEHLRALAGEQWTIIASDRRAFAMLASRFPSHLAGDFFLSMAQGEGQALSLLRSYAAWVGLDEAALDAYEPRAGCQAYTAYVSWLALNGSRAEVGLAFAANLAAWGDNCGRVAEALRQRYGAPEEAVAFFDFFATPPGGFETRSVAVVDEGFAAGESPERAGRAARLLQAYELMFWDTLAAEL